MKIFNQDVYVKDYDCSFNQAYFENKYPLIGLYIQSENACNANCDFCNPGKINNSFNLLKLDKILQELTNKQILSKISITGGEPLINIGKIKDIINICKKYNLPLFLNTNGYNIDKLEEIYSNFNTIYISKHHYDNGINNKIMNLQTPSILEFSKINKDSKICLNCVLQKGYIDIPRKVMLYLEEASKLSVSDIGFVSLMPCNDYCKEKFVDFTDVDFSAIENLYISKEWNQKTYCRCRNYLYMPKNEETDVDVVSVYTRYYVDPTHSLSTLVYDGKYLRQGFGGDIII